MKKKYFVYNEKGDNEFVIIVKEKKDGSIKTSLFTSASDVWSTNYQNTLLISMVNDGNSIKFDRSLKKLGYDEQAHLRVLLNFENKLDDPINQSNYGYILEENVIIF